MNGIVMKITKTEIVVLCDDGKFRNIPHPQELPALGEKIAIPDANLAGKKTKKGFLVHKSWMAAAAFLVLVIGVSIFLSMLSSNQPVTVVAVDINPSVELFVDPDGNVTDVSFQNDEAVLILHEKELINKDVYEALQWVIRTSEKQGFLDPNTKNQVIMISVVGMTNAFQVDFDQTLSANDSYQIYWQNVEKETQERAEKLDLSVNKYVVFEKAKEQGVSLNVDDLRSHSITHTLDQAGLDPQHLFDEKTDHIENEDASEAEAPQVEDPMIEEPKFEDPKVESPDNEVPDRDVSEKDAHNEPAPIVDAPNDESLDHAVSEKDAYSEPEPDDAPKDQTSEKDSPRDDESNDEYDLTVDEFELEFELRQQDRKAKKQKYKYEAEKPNAEMETLLKQLDIRVNMNKEQIVDRVVTIFGIDKSQLIELEVEIKFNNGKEIETEIEYEEDENEGEEDDDDDEDDDNYDDDHDDEHNERRNHRAKKNKKGRKNNR